MSDTHTPGPGPGGDLVVSGTFFREGEDFDARLARREADARLVAAAPELYEHALWVVRLFGTDHPRGKEELKEHVAALRAAVAKVKGDQS